MTDENQSPGEGDDGIFGKLPSSRPGSRSPRRRGAPAPDEEKAAKPKARKASRRPAPAPQRPPAPPEREPAGPPETSKLPPQPGSERSSPQISGVEDLAWAGITVAAHAATAGVRFASRALEAARKSIDRP